MLFDIVDLQKEKQRTKLLREQISEEIKDHGSISFYDFMEKALYDPQGGFYQKRVIIGGKHSDFVTHPKEFSPEFGRTVAEIIGQLDIMNRKKGGINNIISIAAGDGSLDKDVLDYLQGNYPKLYERMHYTLVEVSGRLLDLQRKILKRHTKKVVYIEKSGLDYLLEHKGKLTQAFVYANEWLDSLPIYRVTKKKGKWLEVRVTQNEKGEFIEKYEGFTKKDILNKFLLYAKKAGRKFDEKDEIKPVLNINNNMIEIAEALSKALVSGFSLIIDYGTYKKPPVQNVFSFSRNKLLQKANFLLYPGSVDMTTYVDWGIWMQASKGLGLIALAIDVILLQQLGFIKENIKDYLVKFRYPAVLQSKGGYSVTGALANKLKNASKESALWLAA